MAQTRRRGALIVVEGLDRAGKSTQHNLLCLKLEASGFRVKRIRFPDRTTAIGHSIHAYLRGASQIEDHVIHLLFSANRWEAAASIEEAVKDGITVVIDRYYYSGMVYSAAKNNPAMSLHWTRQPEVGLPRPDICLFLDITPEQAAERGGFGGERYEKKDMQVNVRRLFYELIHNGEEREDVRVIDAGRAIDAVEADIWQHCIDILESNKMEEPLRKI